TRSACSIVAAGEALPPSKPLTGPAPPRRSVCAPGLGKHDRESFLGEMMIVGQNVGNAKRAQGDHRTAVGQAVRLVGPRLVERQGRGKVRRGLGKTCVN